MKKVILVLLIMTFLSANSDINLTKEDKLLYLNVATTDGGADKFGYVESLTTIKYQIVTYLNNKLKGHPYNLVF